MHINKWTKGLSYRISLKTAKNFFPNISLQMLILDIILKTFAHFSFLF